MLSFLGNEGREFLVMVFVDSGKFFLKFVEFDFFGRADPSFVGILLGL
jgi:hypothetical protein